MGSDTDQASPDDDRDVTVELPLRLVAREVGCTYGAELWLGEHLVFAKRAGTRHRDTAVEEGIEMVAKLLRGAAEAHLADERDYDPADPAGLNEYLGNNPL